MLWVDGRLARSDAPVLRADDRGFLYGDGAFETLRAVDGRPVGFARHRARLEATLRALHFPPLTTDLAAAAAAVIEANDLRRGEAIVRLRVSRGPGEGPRPPADARPTVVVT
ncbi:MAG: aminotransferase class IV, partial [Myxococcales bacterium]|nr:aminotransferase class IV [Myxococcales bacterium]